MSQIHLDIRQTRLDIHRCCYKDIWSAFNDKVHFFNSGEVLMRVKDPVLQKTTQPSRSAWIIAIPVHQIASKSQSSRASLALLYYISGNYFSLSASTLMWSSFSLWSAPCCPPSQPEHKLAGEQQHHHYFPQQPAHRCYSKYHSAPGEQAVPSK